MTQKQHLIEDSSLQQKYRSFTKMALITLNLCLSAFYFGYSIAYFSTIDFQQIYHAYDISLIKVIAQGLLTGCIPIGAGIGSLMSSLFLKLLSRRQSLLLINGLAIFFGFLVIHENMWTLFLSRLGQGICVGLYSSIIPLIIKQIAPLQIAGTLGSFFQLLIAIGISFSFAWSYFLQMFMVSYIKLVFGFTLSTLLFQTLILLFVFPFETPKYLLISGRKRQAEKLLQRFYRNQYIEQILAEKQNDLKAFAKQSQHSPKDSKIRKKKNTIPTFIAIHLSILQQFVGINAVVAYGPPIIAQVLPSLKFILPIIINSQQIFAVLLASYLLLRFGRKDILQFGTIVNTFSLLFIAIGLSLTPQKLEQNSLVRKIGIFLILGGMIIFKGVFGLSLGPIVWIYIPQIVGPSVIGIATMFNWIAASLVMILFPIIKDSFTNNNPTPLFLFFAIWTGISFFVNKKYMVQTKDKSQREIRQQFDFLQ